MKTISQNIVSNNKKSLREAEDKTLFFKSLLEEKACNIIEDHLCITNFSLNEADFYRANFTRFFFDNCSFYRTYASFSLMSECCFENCDFSRALFFMINFESCCFYDCLLSDLDFNKCTFENCTFENCTFSEMSFNTANLKVEFTNCIFENVEKALLSSKETIISDFETILFFIEKIHFTNTNDYTSHTFFKHKNKTDKNNKCKELKEKILKNSRRIDINGASN